MLNLSPLLSILTLEQAFEAIQQTEMPSGRGWSTTLLRVSEGIKIFEQFQIPFVLPARFCVVLSTATHEPQILIAI